MRSKSRFSKLLKKCAGSAQAWKDDDAKTDIETRKTAFREASTVVDKPGEGPGEKYTGPVHG